MNSMLTKRGSPAAGLVLAALTLISCASSTTSTQHANRLQAPITWSPRVGNPTTLEIGDILEVSYFQGGGDGTAYRLDAGDGIRVIVGGAPSDSAYRLQPGDEVRLIIRSGIEQGPYRILPDGSCTLPLIGAVPIGGSTIERATRDLERLYGRHYENPSVSLLVSPAAPEGAAYDASVLSDGTCTLPKIGLVRLRGLTVEEATALLTRLYGARQAHVQAEVLVTQSRERTRSFIDAMRGSLGSARRCEVTREGEVLLPLLDPIPALGRSLGEVRRDIAAAYGEKLPDLALNTTLASTERRTIAVLGEVVRSGVYPAPYPMSPLEALSLAGGLTDRAMRSQVILVRPETDGSVSVLALDLDAALDRDDYSSLATAVRSRDLLYVPKSEIANVNMFVQQYLRNMMPVPISFGVGWDLNQ